MLKGSFEHRDHMGNVGLLRDGAVQWMTGEFLFFSKSKTSENFLWIEKKLEQE